MSGEGGIFSVLCVRDKTIKNIRGCRLFGETHKPPIIKSNSSVYIYSNYVCVCIHIQGVSLTSYLCTCEFWLSFISYVIFAERECKFRQNGKHVTLYFGRPIFFSPSRKFQTSITVRLVRAHTNRPFLESKILFFIFRARVLKQSTAAKRSRRKYRNVSILPIIPTFRFRTASQFSWRTRIYSPRTTNTYNS